MSDRGGPGVSWLTALVDALAHDGQAVLVVVATTQGSTPREAGATMVVSTHGSAGSIGGGDLEYEATRVARDALATGESPEAWIVRFPPAARLGGGCAGVATLAFLKIDRHACATLDAALACARTGQAFAVVSSFTATGDGGAGLVVTVDDARGTLGDDALDSSAVAVARTRLAGAASGATLVRTAQDDRATLLIQIERPEAFPVLLFGNGHVGRALVDVLRVVPAQVRWVDARGADFPAERPANVDVVVTDAPESQLRDAPAGSFVVVTTHSHALDFALIEAALARDDWRYIGLIGSKSKRAQFEQRFAARGGHGDAFARVRCPIGAIGIKDKHPGAIAVAIAAELLLAREAAAHASDASRRLAPIRKR